MIIYSTRDFWESEDSFISLNFFSAGLSCYSILDGQNVEGICYLCLTIFQVIRILGVVFRCIIAARFLLNLENSSHNLLQK